LEQEVAYCDRIAYGRVQVHTVCAQILDRTTSEDGTPPRVRIATDE
jgi:hypothetical protein